MPKAILVLAISLVMLLSVTPLFAAFEGLVAYWSLDEGEGEEVKDISGNGHDGVIKGPTWTDGESGKALLFAGQSSAEFVEIPDADDLDGLSALTLIAWARIDGMGNSNYPRIVSKGHEHTWTWMIDGAAGTFLRLTLNIPAEVTATDNSTPLQGLFGEFHHYAVTWDGAIVVFYIDGEKMSEHDLAGGPTAQTTNPVLIGNSSEGRTFQGVLDEVGIFNVALSQGDIESIMENGLAVEPADKLPTVWGNIKGSHFPERWGERSPFTIEEVQ